MVHPETLHEALPESRAWPAAVTESDLDGLGAYPAVYLLVDQRDQPILLASTQSLRRAVSARLLERPEASARADLRAVTRGIRWCQVHSPFEARWCYYRLARLFYPDVYRKQVGFGPAWFLHVDSSASIPEIRVTERIWRLHGQFLGPFPTRATSRAALEDLWDLFDLCRYPEQVRKTPNGQRCSYAEMGRCDAPCDGSVPLSSYRDRTGWAWQFAGGAGFQDGPNRSADAWIAGIETRMKQASSEMAFERAGLLKRQLETARQWRAKYAELVQDESMRWLVILPVTRRKAWKPFWFDRGVLEAGDILAEKKTPTGVLEWLADVWSRPSARVADEVRMEQTWLLFHLLSRVERERAVVVQVGDVGTAPDPAVLADLITQARSRKTDPSAPDSV